MIVSISIDLFEALCKSSSMGHMGYLGDLGRASIRQSSGSQMFFVICWDGASLEIYVMTHDHRKTYNNLLPRCHQLPPCHSLILAPEVGDLSTEIGGIVGTPWFWRTYDMFPRRFGQSNRCQIPNAKHLCSDLVVEVTVWLVVDLPLWKIWVRQLGWWHSQLNEKIKVMFVPNHQPAI